MSSGDGLLAGGLDEVVARCAQHGTVAVPLVADLADEADRPQIVDSAAAQLGGPSTSWSTTPRQASTGQPPR